MQLLVCVLSVSTVWAQSTDQQISRLINQGRFLDAQELLDGSDPSEVDLLFFSGRILKATLHYSEAVEVFEEILRRRPDHINAKRELAHTLLLAKKYFGAESRFRELLRTDTNEIMRVGYQQFLGVIEQNKRLDVELHFALLPSSNINKGTDNAVFDSSLGEFLIDPSMTTESGLGLQFGAAGFFRHIISSQSKVQLDWKVSQTAYHNEIYDNSTGLVSLTYDKETLAHKWSMSTYSRNVWRNNGLDSNAIGVRFNSQQVLTSANRFAVSILHEYRIHPAKSYQDGSFTSASLSVTHLLDDEFSVSVGVQGESSSPQAEHLQYIGHAAFAEIQKTWDNGTRTTLGVKLGDRGFLGDYPLTNSPREDIYYSINISVFNEKLSFAGLSPKLTCGFTSNASNVAFFDYQSTDCQISFTF